MKTKYILLAGAILGLLGVATGAFGAHALKAMLTASGRVDTFELAVRYQFYHAFALLITGLLHHHFPMRSFRLAAYAFLLGTILFSGSLYTLCFTGISAVAMITPFGGVLLLLGWGFLIAGVYNAIQ